MSHLVCHNLKIWIGKYKADISGPTCGSSSALSRQVASLLLLCGISGDWNSLFAWKLRHSAVTETRDCSVLRSSIA
jgi:hypothetical protein